MDDAALEAALYPARRVRPADEDVDWAAVEKDLAGRGVTLKLLWGEWRETHPDGMNYVTWCRRFRDWRPCKDVTMRQNRHPGERLFVDYAGMTVPVFIDGVGHDAQLFVASMGVSVRAYVEAEHWHVPLTAFGRVKGVMPQHETISFRDLTNFILRADSLRWQSHQATCLDVWLPCYPARPRKRASDRFTLTKVVSSICPNDGPSLSAFTVMGLSSMICEVMLSPLSAEASTVKRRNGASTNVDVMGRMVTEPRSANWFAWMIKAERGLP